MTCFNLQTEQATQGPFLVWEYHKNCNKKEELPLSLTKPFKLPICKALDVTSVFFINNTTLYNNRKTTLHYRQSAGGLTASFSFASLEHCSKQHSQCSACDILQHFTANISSVHRLAIAELAATTL